MRSSRFELPLSAGASPVRATKAVALQFLASFSSSSSKKSQGRIDGEEENDDEDEMKVER